MYYITCVIYISIVKTQVSLKWFSKASDMKETYCSCNWWPDDLVVESAASNPSHSWESACDLIFETPSWHRHCRFLELWYLHQKTLSSMSHASNIFDIGWLLIPRYSEFILIKNPTLSLTYQQPGWLIGFPYKYPMEVLYFGLKKRP